MKLRFLVAAAWLLLAAPAAAADFQPVACEGVYPHHLQGVCTDGREAIFWSFTTRLVKTDREGKVAKQVEVGNHHGDLCFHEDKIFVAVNFGKFNDPQGNADSWVYVYRPDDLSLLAKHRTPEVFHGAGGIAYHAGKFLVVGGLPTGVQENYAYEYDEDFRFVQKRVIPSGWTRLGIQTAAFADGHWWFGCYGEPQVLLKVDPTLQQVERFRFDCSLGVVPLGEGRFLVGRGACSSGKGCTGRLALAHADQERGLFLQAAGVSFQQHEDRLRIAIDGRQVAEYVFQDEQVRRPYFRHLKTLSGVQVTRTHPPAPGKDLDDHASMHPGLWLAFGDLHATDFWRNQGRVRQVRFLRDPAGGALGGSFAVQNAYEADGRTLCTEDCEITLSVRPDGYLLDWTSTFRSDRDFTFGDQEEMGLGVRVATPMAVVRGGEIIDSEGRKNEPQVWGQQADWCSYSAVIQGERAGVALLPDPGNFRRSWLHARDYGLLVANPFGRHAFTQGEKSRVTVRQGEEFRLRFGVLVYGVSADRSPDLSAAYREYVALLQKRAAPPQSGTHKLEITSGGFERTVHIHVPPGYRPDARPPLVLALHGAGGDGLMMLQRNGWARKADQEGFLVAAPTGLPALPRLPAGFRTNPRVWNSGQLNPNSPRTRVDDVRFVADLLEELQQRWPYDERRVFATGHSNGAGMTFRLGAELSERFAALAPVAGMLAIEAPRPKRPLPTLYIVGTEDPLQPLEGGEVTLPWGKRTNPPVSGYLAAWAKALGCEAEPTTLSEQGGVKKIEYPARSGPAALTAIFIEGHGHEWPGGSSLLPARLIGRRADHFHANDVIWDFFQSQPPQPTSYEKQAPGC